MEKKIYQIIDGYKSINLKHQNAEAGCALLEDGDVLGTFENIDEAKKAFEEYNANYHFDNCTKSISVYEYALYEICVEPDEDGDFDPNDFENSEVIDSKELSFDVVDYNTDKVVATFDNYWDAEQEAERLTVEQLDKNDEYEENDEDDKIVEPDYRIY